MPGALLAALLLITAAPAAAAEAAVATDIQAGQAKTIRIRSLPVGAAVGVRISSSGRVLVSFLGMKHLKAPSTGSKPLFRGVVQEKMSFRVVVPEADDYVLILSNRSGKEAVKVEAEIQAVRRRPDPPPKGYSPRPEKASWSPR
jgi:hypothetical protein